MPPTSHVRLARVQVFAPTTLTKVEGVLPEETVAISDCVLYVAFATCAHNSPTVCSIGTSVPEQHPCMTTALKHLQTHKTPPSTKTSGSFPIAPAMQAIVIDCVSIINPQLAAIIGDDAEPVISCLEDAQTACPTRSEVIAAGIAWPSATCIAIVHILGSMMTTSNKQNWTRTLIAIHHKRICTKSTEALPIGHVEIQPHSHRAA